MTARTGRVTEARCDRCGNEIDEDTCWCGDKHHGYGEGGHGFVPMGCTCGHGELPQNVELHDMCNTTEEGNK